MGILHHVSCAFAQSLTKTKPPAGAFSFSTSIIQNKLQYFHSVHICRFQDLTPVRVCERRNELELVLWAIFIALVFA